MRCSINNFSTGLRYAPYCRVSTTQDSQKDSLENQISFFKEFIKAQNGQLYNVYADHGITGTSLVKREEMKKLMRDAKQRLFDVVPIKSITRWARDTVDSITLIRDLKSLGIRVISIEDGYDSFEDPGEMKLTLLSMIAQQESDNISKNVSFGIREKARNGIFHGTPPYGYSKEKGKLIPKFPEAQVVKDIFSLYLKKGWGRQRIANYLTEKLIPTPRTVLEANNAGSTWHDSTIKIILTNRHYVGDLVQGRSKTDPSDKAFSQRHGYKRRKQIDEKDFIVVPNTHIALISPNDFNEAQVKMAKKAKMRFRGRGKKTLFARLAFCVDCGAGMNFKKDRNAYVCGTYQKRGSKACPSHWIKFNDLKEKVLSDVKELAENSIDTCSLQQLIRKHSGNNDDDLKDDLKQIEKVLKQLEREEMQLVRALTRETIDENTFKKQQQVLESEINIANEKKFEIEQLLFQQEDTEKNLLAFQNEVKKFVQLQISDEEMLRQTLHKLIEKIEVSEDGVITIHYNFKNPLSMGA